MSTNVLDLKLFIY